MESTLIFVLATGVQRYLRAGVWRRSLWQAALIGLGFIAAIELTGISRPLMARAFSQPESTARTHPVAKSLAPVSRVDFSQQRTIVVTASESATPVNAQSFQDQERPENAAGGVAAISQNAAEAFGWWPGIVWVAGFVFVLGRVGLSHLVLMVLCWRKGVSAESVVCEQIQSLAKLLRIERRVRVTYLNKIRGPIAYGIFRHNIGLPVGFERDFTVEQSQVMLVHELAHLAGREGNPVAVRQRVSVLGRDSVRDDFNRIQFPQLACIVDLLIRRVVPV